MRSYLITLLVGWIALATQAQGVGTWITRLSYYNTTAVAEADNNVYAVANGSLYSYGKEDQQVQFHSKQTGLSDNDISMIAYNPNVKTLLIVYSNGNIDLWGENGVYNLPYLLNATNIQDKSINSVNFENEYAYLSGNFGIMVINMSKNEITETYKMSQTVYSSCIRDKQIYAATSEGLIQASLEDNLLDYNNWNRYPLNTDLFDETQIRQIRLFDNRLCLLVSGKGVYTLDTQGTIEPLCLETYMLDMKVEGGKLFAYTAVNTYIYTNTLSKRLHVGTGTTNGISCLKGGDTYWVASGELGLRGLNINSSTGKITIEVADLIASEDSPKRNYNDFMTYQQGRLLVCGGGRWADRYNRAGTFMVLKDNVWTNFNESQIAEESGLRFADVTSAAVDPADTSHYFVSTWGEGVFEFKDNAFVKLHNTTNSTLATISSSDPSSLNYTRVDGLVYDKDGNLWMNNTAVGSCVKILKVDGNWAELGGSKYSSLYNQGIVDKLLITSRGDKWVNTVRGSNVGITVFNEKGTIDDTSDDVVNHFSLFSTANGDAISVSGYFCMAEDKNGNIWLGTNRGPIICPVPNRAIDDPDQIYCTRIIRELNGENSYFLDNVQINAIAVDGGNRKWLGTEGAGIFVVSEDGSETIENFTTDNSPLLSDVINSIAIDDVTGEVFIGTDKGIISYMGEATEGSESYSEVYAYPNPVRPQYGDKVTITGLMSDSNVKITDVAGHLVYQGKSLGGQLTWNCRSYRGERVASGVYLVLAATPEGKESVVTKIVVVK